MTKQEKLIKLEQQLRDECSVILALQNRMAEIDQFAARAAFVGIVEYLTDKLQEMPKMATIEQLEKSGHL